jgi:hypothetical protein
MNAQAKEFKYDRQLQIITISKLFSFLTVKHRRYIFDTLQTSILWYIIHPSIHLNEYSVYLIAAMEDWQSYLLSKFTKFHIVQLMALRKVE